MRHTTLSPRSRATGLLCLLATTGLVASACSSSDDSTAAADDGGIVLTDDDSELVIESDPAAATDDPPADAGNTELIVDESAAAVESTGDDTEEELALQFADCMRSEGLDWPDPTTQADGSIDITGGVIGAGPDSPVDVRSDESRAALDVCGPIVAGASFLPNAGNGLDTETQDQLLEFSQCLRDNGVDVDDPDFSGGGLPTGGLFGDFDPEDPANADAIEVCQTLFAGGVGG